MKPAHLSRVVLLAVSVLVVLQAGVSLAWSFAHDTSVLLYEAFLIDRLGYVPYRDFWDINLPGTHFAHVLIGRATGYSTGFALRVFDLAYLAGLLGVAFAWLRRLGTRVAWSAVALFALTYLVSDFRLLMQREYLALLPILLAVVVATGLPRLDDRARAALVGLLFGVVATVKPHLTLALPVVLLFGYLEARGRLPSARAGRGRVVTLLACAAAGFCLPPLTSLAYLAASGALPYFLEIVRSYYPLYGYVTSTLEVVPPGPARTSYMIRSYLQFGGYAAWLVPAAAGLLAVFGLSEPDGGRKRQVLLLGALTAVFSVYPALTGQFFEYHWLPFLFFLLATASLCFVDLSESVPVLMRWLPPVAAVLAIGSGTDLLVPALRGVRTHYIAGARLRHPSSPAVEAIADHLGANLRPGDKVQALDWVDGGVLQAMLAARAETATPYLTDAVFYYKIDDPYVRKIRADFLRRMATDPPRFLVEFRHEPWLAGPDATGEFDELWGFVRERYHVAVDLGSHRVYERLLPP